MGHKAIEKMWDRVELARSDNDTSLFFDLMLTGEMILKLITASVLSAIEDDNQRNRYSIAYKLIRADGLGDWNSALDEALIGPAAQFLTIGSQTFTQELVQRVGRGSWQYEAYECIKSCIKTINEENGEIQGKIDMRTVLRQFSLLRNKTKAHGALPSRTYSELCPQLEKYIKLLMENLKLIYAPWCYLHRSLSGKYRITEISGDSSSLQYLKKSSSTELPKYGDGVYIIFDSDPIFVELVHSDVDLFDFYFPNGQFTQKKYELLSYITGSKKEGDSSKYSTPATQLPESETEGNKQLIDIGKVFSNVPANSDDYIRRKELEQKLTDALISENHPIITLKGSGGIGKTWLTLEVLHQICKSERQLFDAIFWFSARDIDLLLDGPKRVRPRVLDQRDVANVFVDLLCPSNQLEKNFKSEDYLASNLKKCELGKSLFVFDNFETVKNPADFYLWLDTYIRLPNKILITTRVRDFKADFDVNVGGMHEDEAENLITSTAKRFGILDLITGNYRQELLCESEGHPYVMKILLGEVAKAKKTLKVERLIANKDDLLTALFERTYNNLSPVAKRVFVTLCNWHSHVSRVALEAILLRPENDRMDVFEALDELEKSSFVEVKYSKSDNEMFVYVPLVAMLFGKKKLSVSPYKSAVEADTVLLKSFGTTNSSEVNSGLAPRVEWLFTNLGRKINQDPSSFAYYLPILEYVARRYPSAWLLIANLYQELPWVDNNLIKAKDAVSSLIQNTKLIEEKSKGWKLLAQINRILGVWLEEIQALVELSQLPNTEFSEISNSANRLNALLKDKIEIESDVKKILGTKLLALMDEKVAKEGSGTDYSRMAWLAINLGLQEKGYEYTELGFALDPDNEYIQSLVNKYGLI
jgi:hypothetical protein